MKKLLSALLALCIVGGCMPSIHHGAPGSLITANAEDLELSAFDDESQGDWTYKLYFTSKEAEDQNGDYYRALVSLEYIELIGYTGYDTDVVIPKTLTINNINSLEWSGVRLPSNMKLSEGIEVPVKAISDDFWGFNDKYISSVNIQAEITKLPGIFYGSSVSSVTLPDSLMELSYFSESNIESITIPPKVAEIPDEAFENCKFLEKVTLSEGVKVIGGSAFKGCKSLESINLPSTLQNIGSEALMECYSLTDVDSSAASLKTIGERAFEGCSSLTEIDLSSSGLTSIGESGFYGSGLYSISLPEGFTSLGNGAFSNCKYLKSVELPDTLKVISEDAFSFCSSLSDVKFGKNLSTIGMHAFWDCDLLEELVLPDSLSTIGEGAFSDCKNLSVVNLPDKLKSIGSSAFGGTAIEEIIIPDSVKDIGSYTFYDCKYLTSVKLPSGLKSIPEFTFAGTQISSLDIPDSVVSIEGGAFANCGSLKKLNIPSSVKAFGGHVYGDRFEIEEDFLGNGRRVWYKYDDVAIEGTAGSAAENYAKENGIEFVEIDENRELVTTTATETTTTTTTAPTTTSTTSKTTAKATTTSTITTAKPTTTSTTTTEQIITTASKLSIEETSISLINGEQYTIKANQNGLTYSSNNKNVAVVSKEGVVTAIGEGEATISVINSESDVVQLKIKVEAISTTTTAKSTTTFTTSTTTISTTTESTITSTTIASTFTLGDVTGDGIIDGRDATAILTYYAKTSTGYSGTLEEYMESIK